MIKHKCLFFKLLFTFFMINTVISDYESVNNLCVFNYCNEYDINELKCSINKTIFNSYFVNNIIWIGDKYFRYVNLATYSNGDLVVESSSSQGSSKRMFYGIKANGRSFFKIKGKSKYLILEVDPQTGNPGNGRLDSENFIAKINGGDNDGNEYLVSVSKENGYVELYDFENNKIYQRSTNTFLEFPMDGIRGTSSNFILNNIYYSLFGYSYSANNQYFVFRFKFTSLDISNNIPNYLYYYNNNVIGKRISCYIYGSTYFVCFYIYKNMFDLKTYGFIKILDEDFNQIGGMDVGYVLKKKLVSLFIIIL